MDFTLDQTTAQLNEYAKAAIEAAGSGASGSIRIDVILGPSMDKPAAIYDLKMGSARPTQARADQIRARFPGFTGPIIAVYPYMPSEER